MLLKNFIFSPIKVQIACENIIAIDSYNDNNVFCVAHYILEE